MLDISFRPCQPADVEAAVPLIYSSGPDAFNYVFCDSYQQQSADFLKSAFIRGPSEFGYQQHTAAVLNGEVVGVGGVRFARQNLTFTVQAARDVFGFFGLMGGGRTALRGLRTELVIKPPAKGVGVIYQLGVSPAWRSHGIGERLIAQLLNQIAVENLDVAGLDVADTNPRAQALYERLGFTVKATHKGTLRSQFGHVVDHHYMERQL